MKKMMLAFLGALTFTSVASAEEVAMPAAQGSACGFSGLYTGLGLGYDFGKVSLTNGLGGASVSPKGFGGGLFAGWGTELSKIYLGIELGYYLSAAKKTETATSGSSTADIETKIKDRIEVAARIGYSMGKMLPYVKVGYGWSQGAATDKASGAKILDKRVAGLVFGAGLDYKINQKLLVGLSYTYADLEKKFTVTTGSGASASTISNKAKLTDNNIMLRVAYQF